MIRFSNYISEDAHELIFTPQDDLKEPDYDDIEIFKMLTSFHNISMIDYND